MDAITNLLAREGFIPHGYCFSWSPALLWSMVGADGLIAASYFSIPLTMAVVWRRRPDLAHRRVAQLFAAFIFACGLTHAMDIWTIWQADYTVQAAAKGVTAAVSVLTALVLWRMVPVLLTWPSVQQLQAAVRGLETEVARRRTAEEQLAATEQSLAVTLASIGAGFISTDRQGCVVRMNRVAEELLDWTQAQAHGKSVWTVFRREGRPQELLERNPVDVLLEQGVTAQQAHQEVAVSRDGRRTEVEVKAEATRDAAGGVMGMAIILRDRTQQMRAAATESRLAAIIESSNDAIISKTLSGQITSWNHAATALFGYPADEAIGRPIQMLIPPDRQDEEMRIIAELARGSRVPPFETVRLRRDGSPVEVQVSISPVRDAQGRIIGASKIASDITQRRQAERAQQLAQALEAENRQMQQANRMKSQFLANMSHELRTPLNAVIGFAELLRAGRVPADSPKHAEFLGHIAVSGRHLLQLINDVLDLSKVDSGKLDFHPEPVDLRALLGDIVAVLQQTSERKSIRVTVEVDESLTGIELDGARLKQAAFNYISNALKFTPEGGRIMVRARPEGALRFRLEVQDTGIGIEEADLPRLFTEFQQLDAGLNKQHGGTGLGLALTRRLVEAQGGQVGVDSRVGVGSVFYLVLDRVVRIATVRTLLVVSEDAVRRAQLVGRLAVAGVEADEAASAREAFEQARRRRYRALTLDLELPDDTGLGALGRIRGDGASSESPVVGLTMGHEGRAAAFHVADVLRKPLQTQEVVRAMSRLARPEGRPPRVLVIDDDPMALDLMGATLASLGVQWRGETNASTALAQLDEHRPDAIVLDLVMPGMDGFEALDLLRRLHNWHETPVFIWTSLLLTEDEVARLARSAQAILHKGGGSLDGLIGALHAGQGLAPLQANLYSDQRG